MRLLKKLGIVDKIGSDLGADMRVVITPRRHKKAAPDESDSVSTNGVAEIAATFVGGARSVFLQDFETGRFLSALAKKVGNAQWRVDLVALKCGGQISDHTRDDRRIGLRSYMLKCSGGNHLVFIETKISGRAPIR